MNLIHYQNLPKSVTASVVSVGNFDGIHRGHEVLIREVVKRAKNSSGYALHAPHFVKVHNEAGFCDLRGAASGRHERACHSGLC